MDKNDPVQLGSIDNSLLLHQIRIHVAHLGSSQSGNPDYTRDHFLACRAHEMSGRTAGPKHPSRDKVPNLPTRSPRPAQPRVSEAANAMFARAGSRSAESFV